MECRPRRVARLDYNEKQWSPFEQSSRNSRQGNKGVSHVKTRLNSLTLAIKTHMTRHIKLSTFRTITCNGWAVELSVLTRSHSEGVGTLCKFAFVVYPCKLRTARVSAIKLFSHRSMNSQMSGSQSTRCYRYTLPLGLLLRHSCK